MDSFYLVFGTIIPSLISLIAIPLLPEKNKSTGAFILVFLIALISSIPAIQVLCFHRIVEAELFFNYPIGTVVMRIDPLSAWFMLIINLTCLFGSFYGIGYMSSYKGQKNNLTLHWIMYVILHTALLWVCMVQNGLAFLVVWEIMSISCLLLVIFEHQKSETLRAGLIYLVQMHMGVALMSVGFIWVYIAEGSFDFAAIGAYFSHNSPIWLFLIFFVGFGFKAGFLPLHTWLPHAHPASPSHVSGTMSGVIVKMGIYGILRIITYLDSEWLRIGIAILILSLLTSFYGILNAAVHRDYKKMLAFCTIENIGIIGMGIGLGLIGKGTGNDYLFYLGFSAALLHTLNHSLYKALLFFTAGNIYQQTHTRNMEHLGGLIKVMPVTAIAFLCGSLAIGGLPPFNGFVSEFLIYTGLLDGLKSQNVELNVLMILSIAVLAIVGGVSMLTFTKSFGTIFLGSPRMKFEHPPKEVSVIMQIPLWIMIGIMLLIGIFPNYILTVIQPVVQVFNPAYLPSPALAVLDPTLTMVGRISFLLIAMVALLYFIRSRRTKASEATYGPTWGCAYIVPNPRMQYTGKSFTKTLAKMFSVFTAEKKEYRELQDTDVFPTETRYISHYNEFFETRIIDPLDKRLLRLMNYFSFIHNGRTQMYILYGLLFILVFIAATFLNLI
ncbi:proton-conducting transporter transmembrane domain-containing protein [Arcticibacter eurypsychrophilus]|uniref:proton-conducting transporter transmembrane domain-containing protein n=1 Tax=Arcticibacter eurypsychrophilus TaxID=1434752 RepID=UPI00084DE20D|nr:proton-conducting transporter membrane subunit [Arcticibacter eurypsychrophilus]